MVGLPPDWLIPDWPAPANVRAVFTTRQGGVSQVPFDSMNLGDHVQDQPDHVVINRQRLANALQAQPVFMQQVHGTQVLTLEPGVLLAQTPIADACLTSHPAQVCTVMVADCLPVLFTTRDGSIVAAAHAGWRGLCQGVLEAVFHQICQLRHASNSDVAIKNIANEILVWLGPAIGPSAFEVGEEVRQAFIQASADPAQTTALFQPHGPGKYLANLAALARQRLFNAGIMTVFGNDGSPLWCTVNHPNRYFSHRRDAASLGGSGRMAACIWRVP